jgi:uncharacterized protein (DUF1015 family)
MPAIHPFRAVTYSHRKDLTSVIAPPYDVLDANGKKALLDRDPKNIVAVDLPHTPAKELGPPEAYAKAADLFTAWLKEGTLAQLKSPAIFAYRQSFTSENGKHISRSGMACCVEALPFGPRQGGGILPHEETFSGPKEDRMALMKATRAQMSPIFGLHADEQGRATSLIQNIMSSKAPDMVGTLGSGASAVKHEVWTITDPATIRAYQDALAGEDVFIADGHHRYNTALNYLAALESGGGGKVASDHPARRVMIVLVGMSDPGLIIWPTHRVLGGMKDYTFEKFASAAREHLRITPVPGELASIELEMMNVTRLPAASDNTFGLYDFATRKCYTATLVHRDPLRGSFPDKPQAWRELDVALIQYILVEQICQPKLNSGQPVKWAFPHTLKEVEDIGSGVETGAGGGKNFAQLAVIVRPTPLSAVKDVSRANQLMPQKSTFFYPKLATGLFMNAVG